MSKFFVGQRVRVVRKSYERWAGGLFLDSPHVPIGTEGTISAINAGGRDAGGEYVGVYLIYDGYRSTYPTGEYAARPETLEPLTPPRREEVVTWDEAPFSRDGKWKEVVHA